MAKGHYVNKNMARVEEYRVPVIQAMNKRKIEMTDSRKTAAQILMVLRNMRDEQRLRSCLETDLHDIKRAVSSFMFVVDDILAARRAEDREKIVAKEALKQEYLKLKEEKRMGVYHNRVDNLKRELGYDVEEKKPEEKPVEETKVEAKPVEAKPNIKATVILHKKKKDPVL